MLTTKRKRSVEVEVKDDERCGYSMYHAVTTAVSMNAVRRWVRLARVLPWPVPPRDPRHYIAAGRLAVTTTVPNG
jgi:hypothetical protein